MVVIHVRHNGKGFGAYYRHYGSHIAAFGFSSEEFKKYLEKFIRRCKRFGIKLKIVYHPSYFCGLRAESGDARAKELIILAERCEGPWADWDIWAHDASEQYEDRFAQFGYPIEREEV